MRIAVVGGQGFIGSNVVAYGRNAGMDVCPVRMPRVRRMSADSLGNWGGHSDFIDSRDFNDLRDGLEPFDVVINAAGCAISNSSDRERLFAANAVLPLVVAEATRAAGVPRFVHISTAAVQGRLDPLDESARHFPLSPYGRSKAEGERRLLESAASRKHSPLEIRIFRPTSVHGVGHRATEVLARAVRRLPLVPVIAAGDYPVPVALLENVSAGILFAAVMRQSPPIILQPSEGITSRSLLEIFGAHRMVHLPRRPSYLALDGIVRLTSPVPLFASRVRWFDLLLRGQAISACALAVAGFQPPIDLNGWLKLARVQLRNS